MLHTLVFLSYWYILFFSVILVFYVYHILTLIYIVLPVFFSMQQILWISEVLITFGGPLFFAIHKNGNPSCKRDSGTEGNCSAELAAAFFAIFPERKYSFVWPLLSSAAIFRKFCLTSKKISSPPGMFSYPAHHLWYFLRRSARFTCQGHTALRLLLDAMVAQHVPLTIIGLIKSSAITGFVLIWYH